MTSPLISSDDLRASLGTVTLLDARPAAAYAAGHLPGALHVDPDRDLSTALQPGHDPARGGRHPLPAAETFARWLGTQGITPATEIVVYDATAGAHAATRVWWMLRSLGHTRVRVLDGGLAAVPGLATDTTMPAVTAAPPYPHHGWTRPMVDADAVDARRTADDWKVIDVRSGERFRGETEPFDPIAGHIPGAHNVPYGENLGADGRFKSAAELRALYDRVLGTVPPSQVIVHCGSGVTACHTLLALELAGLPGSSLYVGSWSEWCRSDRTRAKG
jgi:thiosulfate/3-mercaptopyruvate sulfurtransferase